MTSMQFSSACLSNRPHTAAAPALNAIPHSHPAPILRAPVHKSQIGEKDGSSSACPSHVRRSCFGTSKVALCNHKHMIGSPPPRAEVLTSIFINE